MLFLRSELEVYDEMICSEANLRTPNVIRP